MTATLIDPGAEAARLEALRRYQVLDTPPEGAFDRVVALAARAFGAPIASVTFVEDERVWIKAHTGLAGVPHDLAPDPGLCVSAILESEPYVVADTLTHPEACDHPLVRDEPHVRFYAAAPIVTADGHRLGTVNVMDVEPREVDEAGLHTLTDLAALVATQLETRLSARAALTLERRLRQQAEAERGRLELLTSTLRKVLLPPSPPKVPGLDIATHYHVASADQVGGDFFDVFRLDEHNWAFFLGDVCGKGADAAVVTALARHTLRAAAVYAGDPEAVLANLNMVLMDEFLGADPCYCTVLYGVLTPTDEGTRVKVAGGGHPPALVVRAGGDVEALRTEGGMLVGLLQEARFAVAETTLLPGDGMLLYTDGLTEARTPAGHMYGEDRLRSLAAGLAGQPAQAVVTRLEETLSAFGPGLTDDTAILSMTVPPIVKRHSR
ncbi:PP2C family protein-serine/threonine phosphatase [Nonomuraea rhodomycinica]|uniref:SpoIIE family protein phosphatase n=1 Tax=Nonomuraea rhodomycinica TaxID=1712872 RepID=A0A7Y6ISU1_9ACTN|nr:GAF domain-containing SpoIIE family protein phosphatase [Nonomuraea rhodomycinica]NUW43781.1 SpoIIE family protein phosphatase [Nonomuraea rhodomycinica]